MKSTWILGVLTLCVSGLSAGAQSDKRLDVKELEIESVAVGRTLDYSVIMPESYGKEKDRLYPVLYLLHGYGGNYTDWTRALGAPTYAADYDLILVSVDAGNSRYVNWSSSEEGEVNAWEDYILEELIPAIDGEFRTIASREGRAITGLSMGGYGAMTLGLRHPELFASIGSISGSLASARNAAERLRDGEAAPERDPSPEALERRKEPNPFVERKGFSSIEERTPKGVIYATARVATAHDPFRLIARVSPSQRPALYIDCGTEDRLIESNKEFVGVLLRNDIPFSYYQGPGGHDASFWIEALGRAMAVQYETLMRGLGRRPMARRMAP